MWLCRWEASGPPPILQGSISLHNASDRVGRHISYLYLSLYSPPVVIPASSHKMPSFLGVCICVPSGLRSSVALADRQRGAMLWQQPHPGRTRHLAAGRGLASHGPIKCRGGPSKGRERPAGRGAPPGAPAQRPGPTALQDRALQGERQVGIEEVWGGRGIEGTVWISNGRGLRGEGVDGKDVIEWPSTDRSWVVCMPVLGLWVWLF